jgi:hypothetical protein
MIFFIIVLIIFYQSAITKYLKQNELHMPLVH